jgi:very-short-patch-repair endonuclease
MDSGPEPFFIKNLENVQGDERDVIFISATYGPDEKGNQYQRFGPINGPNGHRRLNVLFTRAKKRTEVFSSLDPDRIQTTSSSAWGLRALKQYLTFARSGVLEAADDGSSQPSNDLERSVGAVLIGKGFEVIPQVGVAGFFIDLAVRHPTKPGTYVLGIECDGASYHSGRSARDRDRLRQEILENQGWRIHRIWSTDWFKSRNTEIKRLLKKIEDLLNSDPDYRKEVERAGRVKSLKQQLIDLREKEIKTSFPNAPAESELLRPMLLDEFVRRRPRKKDEWFRLISYELRSQTDSKQVGQYLGKVLDIIASTVE